MRSIDNRFYKSAEWKACRSAYIADHPLCERCQQKGLIVPAEIVHHKIHLTPENYRNPQIALSFDNLESVCRDCHNKEHFSDKTERRREFVDGELVMKES